MFIFITFKSFALRLGNGNGGGSTVSVFDYRGIQTAVSNSILRKSLAHSPRRDGRLQNRHRVYLIATCLSKANNRKLPIPLMEEVNVRYKERKKRRRKEGRKKGGRRSTSSVKSYVPTFAADTESPQSMSPILQTFSTGSEYRNATAICTFQLHFATLSAPHMRLN